MAQNFLGPKSDYFAVNTTGDGYCLFNAISLAIHNTESCALELRYRTCLKNIRNKLFYSDEQAKDGLALVSGSFNGAIPDCAKNCIFSTAYAVHAASSVIGRPIRYFYPSINCLFDKSIGILNRGFNVALGNR